MLKYSIVFEVSSDKRKSNSIENIQRFYGAISFDGKTYKVKTTVKKVLKEGDSFFYEVQETEMVEENDGQFRTAKGTHPTSSNLPPTVQISKLLNLEGKSNSDNPNNTDKQIDESKGNKNNEHTTIHERNKNLTHERVKYAKEKPTGNPKKLNQIIADFVYPRITALKSFVYCLKSKKACRLSSFFCDPDGSCFFAEIGGIKK